LDAPIEYSKIEYIINMTDNIFVIPSDKKMEPILPSAILPDGYREDEKDGAVLFFHSVGLAQAQR
jgi:hypothetical protein